MCQHLDIEFCPYHSFFCLREHRWPGCFRVSWTKVYLSAHLRWVHKTVTWKAVNINCFGMWFILTITFLFLQSYLDTFSYSNAEQDDLWRHFQMVLSFWSVPAESYDRVPQDGVAVHVWQCHRKANWLCLWNSFRSGLFL